MSVTPCPQELGRNRQVPPLGHPGRRRPARRSAAPLPSRRRLEPGSSTRAARSWMSSKTTARPSCCEEARVGRRDSSSRRRPEQSEPCRTTRLPPLVERTRRAGGSPPSSTISAPARFSRTVRPDDGQCVEMQQVGDLRHHRREPAGVVEVLHQVPAGGLQVDEPRRRRARARRSARVADRRRRDPRSATRWRIALVEPEIACRTRIALSNASEVSTSLGLRSRSTSSTICRPAASARRRAGGRRPGSRRRPGSVEPERLGDARHRRGGAHGHAVAVRAGHRVLDLLELGLADPPGPELLVVVPAVAARAELPAAPVAVQHRPARDHDRGHVRARSAHQPRPGFVLSQPVRQTTPSSG